ncbi:MAG: sulfotransferase [Chthoniobacterales bacterium]
MRRVDFLVIGAQKSGTTALNRMLRQHPSIGLADRKEVHFFDWDPHFADGEPDYEAFYHCHFEPGGEQVLGENTPVYLYWRPAAERIARYHPGMKLVAVLRNPIDRAYSHWQMTTRNGEETLPFGEAIRREDERCGGGQHRFFSYVDRGRYAGQVRRFRECFPAEQMLIFRSEELRGDSEAAFHRMSDFLGVGRRKFRVRRKPEKVRYDEEMSAADREFLRGVFATEIEELEALLGWDCSGWR